MTLTCQLSKLIQKDFSALWTCKQRGETIEVSTPYMLPDSTLFSVFITMRKGRFIVCDGGNIMEILSEYCPLPNDEIRAAVNGFAARFEIKQCVSAIKKKLFFIDSDNRKELGSLVFDLANFATTATNALIAPNYDETDIEPDKRFKAKADAFLRSVTPEGMKLKGHEIKEVPGVNFSGVIRSNSCVWLIAYVSGSNPTLFRNSIGVTKMNFEHAWETPIAKPLGGSRLLGGTIPFINTEASGYQPPKLKWQLEMLRESSHGTLVNWSDRDRLPELLLSSSHPLSKVSIP